MRLSEQAIRYSRKAELTKSDSTNKTHGTSGDVSLGFLEAGFLHV